MAGDPSAVGGDDERAAAVGRLHLQGALLWRVLGRVAAPVSNSGEPFFYPSGRLAAWLTEMSGLGVVACVSLRLSLATSADVLGVRL